MRKLTIYLFIVILVLSLGIFGLVYLFGTSLNENPQPDNSILENRELECERVNGVWKEFNNGCVDSCDYIRRNDIGCSQAFEWSCECGAKSCWNGETCEPN